MTKQELESKKCKIDYAIQAAYSAMRQYYRDLIQAAEKEIAPDKYEWGYCIYEKHFDCWRKMEKTGSFFGYEIRSKIGAKIALRAMRKINRICLVNWCGNPQEYEIRRNGRRVKLSDVAEHVLGIEWI